ncbi:MAG: rhomboid protease GluP [Myxococcota bacterium]|jgi:rhomboid protease GluP
MAESRAVLCPGCRKLISSDEQACPHCGIKKPTLLMGPLAALSRSTMDMTMIIVNVSGVLYAASLLIDLSAFSNLELGSIWGLLGIGSPTTRALYVMGMTGGLAWGCGHYWTMLTATFLHGSLMHIFFNLYWLRMLGPMTISELGPVRFIVLYLLTGVSGFLLSNLWSGAPTIGASCAIFGLMGALIAYGRKRGGRFGNGLSQQVTAWAIAGFLISFMIPHVNNAGHLGGFIGGLVLGAIFPARPQPTGRGLQVLALGLLLATAAGFGLSGWSMWLFYSQGLPLCR